MPSYCYTCMGLLTSEVVLYSVAAVLGLVVSGIACARLRPYYAFLRSVATALSHPIIFVDGKVTGACDAAANWFDTHCAEVSNVLDELGVPFPVLFKQVLVPLIFGSMYADACASSIIPNTTSKFSYSQLRGYTPKEAMSKSMHLAYNCLVVVGVASLPGGQRPWEPCRALDQKPVTLALLLVPCILGLHVPRQCRRRIACSRCPAYERMSQTYSPT